MKGTTIHSMPDTIMDIVSIILVIVNVATILIGSTELHSSLITIGKDRQLIYFSEAVLNSKCLVYKENGIVIKGIFDKNSLDSNAQTCLKTDEPYSIRIMDMSGGRWEFGTSNVNIDDYKGSRNYLSYSTVVKYQDKIVPATMEIVYG
jgi:hypothetical protein